MRIFAISDIHIDFPENYNWLKQISCEDYKNDILILAGDISNQIIHIEETFTSLTAKFLKVFYVPGNHDLWVVKNEYSNSMEKLRAIEIIAQHTGVIMEPYSMENVLIVPLLGWYDYSFGSPNQEILSNWVDFIACKWPFGNDVVQITKYFTDRNHISMQKGDRFIISFSHFLPRIDLMPYNIPTSKQFLYPVLGSVLLDKQIRELGSDLHIYGHSHINRKIWKDGILYINNAYGYPYEKSYTHRKLLCVHEI
ncbi:metallophosphoesterase [Paenibacillus sp. NAIST15-1]|uniref:metallophosphoesterase n=1 Tax=Paenibacillus sp. NAIST15-1 TaxID=1605994 RepID=UPI00086F7C80|nr:metallophosphoesterase [Paenibacillus sp. NAIST15-1]GAV11586.1 metallophosphoesterase [Paenibacillus sp. NAIST15-1]